MQHLGDISKISGASIVPVDIITFGSPCQDLSVAGKQGGLDGSRSALFFEAIRIVKEMRFMTNGNQPRFAVWENVPGAFNSNSRTAFQTVLHEFCKITEPKAPIVSIPKGGWPYAGQLANVGGGSIAYRTIDAQFHGVPQRRRRIILVCDFTGQCAGDILFKPEGLPGYPEKGGTAGEEPTAHIGGSADTTNSSIGNWPNLARTPVARYGGGPCVDRGQNIIVAGFNGWRSAAGALGYIEDRTPCIQATMPPNVVTAGFIAEQSAKACGLGYQEEISSTLRASKPPAICIQSTTIGRTGDNGADGAGIQHNVSYTLDAREPHAVCFTDHSYGEFHEGIGPLRASGGVSGGGTENILCFAPVRSVRRLTPTECARLQGFPDWWASLPALSDMSDKTFDFWQKVRHTHAAVNNKIYKPTTKKQMVTWYNKLRSNSAEYKMWGNGLALPVARIPIHGMAKLGAKTMGSLFDGSGGFPLAGLLSGIQTLWASEIEPYPIAVTKWNFSGKAQILLGGAPNDK